MDSLPEILADFNDTLSYSVALPGVAHDIACFVDLVARAVFAAPPPKSAGAVTEPLLRAYNALGDQALPVIGPLLATLFRLRNYLAVQTAAERYAPALAAAPVPRALLPVAYYLGLCRVLSAQYKDTARLLGAAYAAAPPALRPGLLVVLVPLNLRRGLYPPPSLLAAPALAPLRELCTLVHAGDLGGFEQHLSDHAAAYARHGVLDLVNSLRLVVFRNLLAVVLAAVGPKVRYAQVVAAAAQTGMDIDPVTVHALLVNAVAAGLLRGQLWAHLHALSTPPTGALSFYPD